MCRAYREGEKEELLKQQHSKEQVWVSRFVAKPSSHYGANPTVCSQQQPPCGAQRSPWECFPHGCVQEGAAEPSDPSNHLHFAVLPANARLEISVSDGAVISPLKNIVCCLSVGHKWLS